MIETPEKIRIEEYMQRLMALLETIPIETRINLCCKVLLLNLYEVEEKKQKKQPSPLGTAVKVAFSQDQRPVATLLAFAGPGTSHIAKALDGIILYIRSLEDHLAGGNQNE